MKISTNSKKTRSIIDRSAYYARLQTDDNTPFSQPQDKRIKANRLHPRYDSKSDLASQQLYDEGLAVAAGAGQMSNPTANKLKGREDIAYKSNEIVFGGDL